MTGDVARVSMAVAISPTLAFEVFTRDIDRWWRRGPKYRNSGSPSGVVHIEPRLDGRLFESFGHADAEQIFEVGRVRIWQPPRMLAFSWRNLNYADHESTEVEVEFAPTPSGTLVTVTHRALASLRLDHPARHGLQPSQFVRMTGLWWADQLTSLRQHCTRQR